VTEEIWHLIRGRMDGEDIIVASWPKVETIDASVLKQFDTAEKIITNLRNIRKQNNIANKVKIELKAKVNGTIDKSFDSVVTKMGNLSTFDYVNEKVGNAYSFIVDGNEFFIPFGENIDVEAEIKKIEEELQYTKGFLVSVQKKLSNEKFVAGAPEQVVASERKKEADAVNKITILEEKLTALK
jgi:valyl-tRNA synthetase